MCCQISHHCLHLTRHNSQPIIPHPHPAHLGLQIPPVKFAHPYEAVASAGTGSSIPQSQTGGMVRPPPNGLLKGGYWFPGQTATCFFEPPPNGLLGGGYWFLGQIATCFFFKIFLGFFGILEIRYHATSHPHVRVA